MPGRGGRPGHATSAFVWTEWTAEGLGYPDGFVFVAGMLNGAYVSSHLQQGTVVDRLLTRFQAVGTPDCVTHLAEEIPDPQRNVPLAMLMQYVIGFITGFFYLVAIFYAISDFDALFDSPYRKSSSWIHGQDM